MIIFDDVLVILYNNIRDVLVILFDDVLVILYDHIVALPCIDLHISGFAY